MCIFALMNLLILCPKHFCVSSLIHRSECTVHPTFLLHNFMSFPLQVKSMPIPDKHKDWVLSLTEPSNHHRPNHLITITPHVSRQRQKFGGEQLLVPNICLDSGWAGGQSGYDLNPFISQWPTAPDGHTTRCLRQGNRDSTGNGSLYCPVAVTRRFDLRHLRKQPLTSHDVSHYFDRASSQVEDLMDPLLQLNSREGTLISAKTSVHIYCIYWGLCLCQVGLLERKRRVVSTFTSFTGLWCPVCSTPQKLKQAGH